MLPMPKPNKNCKLHGFLLKNATLQSWLTVSVLLIQGLSSPRVIAQDFGGEFNEIDRAPAEVAPQPEIIPPEPPAIQPAETFDFPPEPAPIEPAFVEPAPVDPGPVAPVQPPVQAAPAPEPPPRPVAGPPSQPVLTKISIGDVVPGVLGRADYLDEQNRRVEVYQFTGRANESIVITLTNSNDPRPNGLSLNPYMRVLNLSAPEDQQYLGGTITPGEARIPTENPLIPVDNQLFLRLPETGEYGIVVYTDPGMEGRYGLQVSRDRTRYFVDTAGVLSDENATLDIDNSPFSTAQFSGNRGQTVHINLTSPDFDPYIFLVNAEGEVIAEDDNSGGNLNARISIELPEDGQYYVIVNSRNATGRGRYRLTIY
ncbi:PPC domain-containing protein [Thermocoleostomius sinensis]|uniref:PPC domain-containing protein n=1 Tax=Thermocoleostomius sinensis A174 TaxID=2016057 RepID=A0A9E9CA54_9CYAN|nr:PPC domain-containing protein [Thermocoleostomius sinensis]WAL58520.1 PPC domain-containing protein [Thermocoleostomius sinensis A174]